jgi:4-azaleucine resistance transporter AzlC
MVDQVYGKEYIMDMQVAERSVSDFKEGIQAGVSIAIGYFPIALTFGLLAKSSGISLGEALSMSIFVYAGASQYTALNLLSLGTGVLGIIVATFILNIRHLLMATSIQLKSANDPLWKKVIYSFGITDETFSVASFKNGKITAGYMFGLGGIAYLSWVLCTGIGYLFGTSLPKSLQESMSIALYAMFIALLMPALSKNKKIFFLAGTGAIFNTLLSVTGLLSTGWSIIASTLVSAILVEWVYTVIDKGRTS